MTSTERLGPDVAAERLARRFARRAPVMVDVRGAAEREQEHIAGSVSMPLSHLVERCRRLPRDPAAPGLLRGRLPLLDCREPVASHGFQQVSELAGGMAAWEASHLPLEP